MSQPAARPAAQSSSQPTEEPNTKATNTKATNTKATNKSDSKPVTQPKAPRKPPKAMDLPVIQKAYDLVKWYVPILNRLPRDHRFTLGERIITGLYDLLEGLILARYSPEKLAVLQKLNTQLDLLRHQTRLLLDFNLIKTERYEHIGKLLNDIGQELGGWIKQQRQRQLAR